MVAALIALVGLAGVTGSVVASHKDNATVSSTSVAQEPFNPDEYLQLDGTGYLQIVKDPDSHKGEKIIVFGDVTQFDPATGTSSFRANTGGTATTYYDYNINTVLSGTTNVLGPVVQGDQFKAYVVVAGSLTYKTTLGGSLTAPLLAVRSIEVIGHHD